jgi:hypothetical protein
MNVRAKEGEVWSFYDKYSDVTILVLCLAERGRWRKHDVVLLAWGSESLDDRRNRSNMSSIVMYPKVGEVVSAWEVDSVAGWQRVL